MEHRRLLLLIIYIIIPVLILGNDQTIVFDDTEIDIDFEQDLFEEPPPDSHCIRTNATISLNLNHTGLQLVYKGFIDKSPITCLTLEGNNIIVIPNGTFDNLPNLTYLNLARNNIAAEKLLSFGAHKNLITLILDGNARNDFSGKFISYGKLPNLKNLYLRNNRLHHLNFSDNFPNLTHLYLSGNTGGIERYLQSIPKTLIHLELEKCDIYRFNISSLQNISSLFIGENNFNKLGCCDDKYMSPGDKKSLKVLSVSHCYIRIVQSDAFKGSNNLEKIDLSFNMISDISHTTFISLKFLKILSLSHNLLNKIPNGISLLGLKKLFLSHNKIETLQVDSLKDFTGLETLSLRGNNIAFIEQEVFAHLKNLSELDLAENRLKKLYKDWAQPFKNFKYLNMNSNQVSLTEFLFLKNSSLKNLFLKNNSINRIKAESMANLPKNVTLHLGSIVVRKWSANLGYIGKYGICNQN